MFANQGNKNLTSCHLLLFQVFDWEAFADSVRYHCLHSKNFDPTIENMVLSSASIFFSFVKDGKDDVSTPCWIQLDVLSALQQGKGNFILRPVFVASILAVNGAVFPVQIKDGIH